MNIPPIIEVGGILISSDILTEEFCCDYEKCHGICCVEGDAGAPVTLDEVAAIEETLDDVARADGGSKGCCQRTKLADVALGVGVFLH